VALSSGDGRLSLRFARMERCFSVEAKRFSFSAKSEVANLRLEERRKGFCGFIFLGFQASAWLLATIEEALNAFVRDLVKYFKEDVKVLMVRGGENKSGRYLEVVVFAEGGRKGAIWIPEGCKGWGWARVAGELRKMISFLGPKDRLPDSEAFPSVCLGGSPSRLGGSHPSYAAVVRGDAVPHVKHGFVSGLRGSDVDLRGLDLLPESWCRVVNDGRVAVNCFELEENPHESTDKSISRGLPFDPLDKGLSVRPLGKKKTLDSHSARGVYSSSLNLNLHEWIRMLASLNLALGRTV
jgi:hypothetical protein